MKQITIHSHPLPECLGLIPCSWLHLSPDNWLRTSPPTSKLCGVCPLCSLLLCSCHRPNHPLLGDYVIAPKLICSSHTPLPQNIFRLCLCDRLSMDYNWLSFLAPRTKEKNLPYFSISGLFWVLPLTSNLISHYCVARRHSHPDFLTPTSHLRLCFRFGNTFAEHLQAWFSLKCQPLETGVCCGALPRPAARSLSQCPLSDAGRHWKAQR